MTSSKAPVRWADGGADVPLALSAAMRVGMGEGPSAAQLDRIVAAVEGGLAGAALEPSAPAPATSASKSFLLKSIAVACAAALGGVLLFYGYASTTGLQAPASTPPAPPSAIIPPAQPVEDSVVPATARKLEPAAAQTRHRTARERRAPAVQRAVLEPSDNDPAAEIALLMRARRALPRSPARALALLDQHDRELPPGAFAEECQALRIEALAALGRKDEAKALAREFRTRYPGSAYLRRINENLGTPSP